MMEGVDSQLRSLCFDRREEKVQWQGQLGFFLCWFLGFEESKKNKVGLLCWIFASCSRFFVLEVFDSPLVRISHP